MFKEAISSLSSKIIGIAKSALDENMPTTEYIVKGAISHFAEQAISNISARSPLLGILAENTIKTSRQIKTRIKTLMLMLILQNLIG